MLQITDKSIETEISTDRQYLFGCINDNLFIRCQLVDNKSRPYKLDLVKGKRDLLIRFPDSAMKLTASYRLNEELLLKFCELRTNSNYYSFYESYCKRITENPISREELSEKLKDFHLDLVDEMDINGLEPKRKITKESSKSEEKEQIEFEQYQPSIENIILANEALEKENLLDFLSNNLEKIVINERTLLQPLLLVFLSALLVKKPLAVIIKASSSAGKSFAVEIIEEALEYFDACNNATDDIFREGYGIIPLNAFSKSSLFRVKNKKAFDRKVLLLGEIITKGKKNNELEKTKIFREFYSNGKLTYMISNPKDDSFESKVLKLDGNFAFIAETADMKQDNQLENRAITLAVNESEEQTEDICYHQAGLVEIKEKPSINKDLFYCIINHFLEGDDYNPGWNYEETVFINPYAKDVTTHLKRKKLDLRMRRYNEFIIRATEVFTRLHYKQRKVENGCIYATVEDNAIILELFEKQIYQTLTGLSQAALDIYNKYIKEEYDDFESFTIRDLAKDTELSYNSLKKKIFQLENNGFIRRAGKEGNKIVYRNNEKSSEKQSLRSRTTLINQLLKSNKERVGKASVLTSIDLRSSTNDIYISKTIPSNSNTHLPNQRTDKNEGQPDSPLDKREEKCNSDQKKIKLMEDKELQYHTVNYVVSDEEREWMKEMNPNLIDDEELAEIAAIQQEEADEEFLEMLNNDLDDEIINYLEKDV